MLPPGMFQETFLLGLSALFLSVAILTRRGQSLRRYWEIPFAFFVFTIAGAADTIFLHGFIDNVLHETPSTNNPLASTVLGTVLAQLVSTLSIVIPIILLTMASGNDLSSIFIDKARIRRGLVVSIISFLGFYVFTGLGLAQGLFPNNGITLSRFIALTPALLVLVLSNGIREELWFRGIFLKKYGKFLRPLPSNMLAGPVYSEFTAFSRDHIDSWIVARLSYAKVWKHCRSRDFPCRRRYSNLPSLPIVHFDVTQLFAGCNRFLILAFSFAAPRKPSTSTSRKHAQDGIRKPKIERFSSGNLSRHRSLVVSNQRLFGCFVGQTNH